MLLKGGHTSCIASPSAAAAAAAASSSNSLTLDEQLDFSILIDCLVKDLTEGEVQL